MHVKNPTLSGLMMPSEFVTILKKHIRGLPPTLVLLLLGVGDHKVWGV